jgi:thymidylate synthase (FAD)
VRSQHHRHRTWSYNEISRRYTDVDLQFYSPKEFRTQHKSNRQASNTDELINPWYQEPDQWVQGMRMDDALRDHHEQSLNLYNKMIDMGVCREQARGVLPQNLYTQYYGSTNLSNLLKFIDLRLHEGAQWEIQKMAQACLEIVTDLFPITVSTYRELRGQGHDE